MAEEVYFLIVEIDSHLQFLETPERHQKVHAVASEPADGLELIISILPASQSASKLWNPGLELMVLPDLMSV